MSRTTSAYGLLLVFFLIGYSNASTRCSWSYNGIRSRQVYNVCQNNGTDQSNEYCCLNFDGGSCCGIYMYSFQLFFTLFLTLLIIFLVILGAYTLYLCCYESCKKRNNVKSYNRGDFVRLVNESQKPAYIIKCA